MSICLIQEVRYRPKYSSRGTNIIFVNMKKILKENGEEFPRKGILARFAEH